MPQVIFVLIVAGVFTAVFTLGQAGYWAYQARKDNEQKELARRLGMMAEGDRSSSLFRDQARDAAAQALGSTGRHLGELLASANSTLSVTELLARMFGSGLVLGLILAIVMKNIPAFFVGGIFGMYIPYFLVNRTATVRMKRMAEQLPDALELMARSLQAGHGLADAFRMCAEELPLPISAEFGRVFETVNLGKDFRDALRVLVDRNPGNFDLRLFVSSVNLQRETGGNLIEILESISDTIRQRFVFKAKVKALTSEARFSAMILGSLPFLVAGAITASNPQYLMPLLEDKFGWGLLGYCITSYGLGVFIMRDMSSLD